MGHLREQFRSKWAIGLTVFAAFVAGFGVSFISRRTVPPVEAKIAVADFRIELPEGETVVTISDRDTRGEELGRLTIQRQGDAISGVPVLEKRIAPREPLSADDVAFLRREIGNAISTSDPPWQQIGRAHV